MKKLILFLLTLTVILGVLASCDNGEISDTETSAESISTDTSAQTTSAESDMETIDKSVVMRAKIIELDSKTALVEPVEEDPARRSADRIYVNINGFSDIGAQVGSIVDITYDGYIMETYPAQIRAQEWSKVSDPITSEPTSSAIDIKAQNLMSNITPKSIAPKESIERENAAAMDFAIDLFKSAEESEKNTLISPLSILCALAMTTNGADGETLAQMEDVLGISASELNLYLYTYINSLPQSEKYKLSLANSIWLADQRLTVNDAFLQTNADYYGADIYQSSFNNQTVRDINHWVNKNTDGMISDIIDDIPSTAVIYLINALAFEADWWGAYSEDNVNSGIFTASDGSQQNAEFMYCILSSYIEDENVKGFIKSYSNNKYAFVALLPDEDISLSDYIDTLNGEKVSALISNAQDTRIKTYMPKFECEYESELSSILQSMGMTDAFNPETADFSNLGASDDGNIFINDVLHKTYIQVGEKGTQAGAVSSVEGDILSPPLAEPTKKIELNRPFVYMIVDCENNIPVFIGTLNNIE